MNPLISWSLTLLPFTQQHPCCFSQLYYTSLLLLATSSTIIQHFSGHSYLLLTDALHSLHDNSLFISTFVYRQDSLYLFVPLMYFTLFIYSVLCRFTICLFYLIIQLARSMRLITVNCIPIQSKTGEPP